MASFPLHTIAGGVQQDIVDELSLVDGTEYEFQNRGDNPFRFYDSGASAPDVTDGKEVPKGEWFTFTADDAVPMWIWGVGGPAVIAYDNAT